MKSALKSRLRLVLVSAFLAAAGGGCQIRNPVIGVHDLEVIGLEGTKAKLVFNVAMTNANDYQASLSTVRYDLLCRGQTLASDRLPSPVTVLPPGKTEFIRLPLAVEVGRNKGLKSVGPEEPLDYQLKGTAVFDFFFFRRMVDFNYQGNLPPGLSQVVRTRLELE